MTTRSTPAPERPPILEFLERYDWIELFADLPRDNADDENVDFC